MNILVLLSDLLLESQVNELTYGRPNWFDRVKVEHLACREKVALFDMSAFAKLEIEVPHHNKTCSQFSIRAHNVMLSSPSPPPP